MKRKELTADDLINWWLEKYHGTNLTEVMEKHPEWREDPQSHSRDFYKTYSVTQEQHDEWNEWMINRLMKHFKCGRKLAKRHSWAIYLNTSPSINEKHF